MTTQLTILNKQGAAIASDTIATIASGGSAKPIPNAQKVFEVGNGHSVLILNSDSMEINGIPVGTLLAAWAKECESPLATIDDYALSFINWLKLQTRDDVFFMSKHISKYIDNRLRFNSNAIADQFENRQPWYADVIQQAAEDPKFKRTYQKAISEQINSYVAWLDGLEHREEGPTNAELEAILNSNILDERIDLWFPPSITTKNNRDKLRSSILKTYGRMALESHVCELGFVGYGFEDLYPRVYSIQLEHFGFGVVRWVNSGIQDPTNHADSAVMWWWAQTNEIQSFLHGYHPQFLDDLRVKVKSAVVDDRLSDFENPDDIPEDEQEVWSGIGDSVFDKLSIYIDQFKERHYANLLQTFNYMDVAELAKVVSTLVDIEVLGTHNSMDVASAGGFIEVATIDKRNGVIWRKRLDV